MRARGLAAAAVLLTPAMAAAQTAATRCNAVNTDSTREVDIKVGQGVYNAFFGGGIVVVCPSRTLRLQADSAEEYGLERRIHLIGRVHYQEPRFTLRSQVLDYFTSDERIVATGQVTAQLPTGSTLTGPSVTYLRVIPGTRPLAEITATGRPTATIIQTDSTGAPQPPVHVTANRLFMKGDSLVYGSGKVDMLRDELMANADSMFLDGPHEIMHLLISPHIHGTRTDHPFTLSAALIDLYSTNRQLTRVLARDSAVATSTDLVLRADSIDFRVADNVLFRAFAWGGHGKQHASARSPTDSLNADSIDVHMPGQRAREIHAVGLAYAQSTPDTGRFVADGMDWMRGDTITAWFDSTATDSTKSPKITRLVAITDARAYYNMAPRDTSLCAPALSYSRGRQIVVSFNEKGVARVDVHGQTYGMLAEPNDSLPANRCPTTTAKAPAAKTDSVTHSSGGRTP